LSYRAQRPSAPLDAFIERLWHCADAPAHARERILPAGTVELVIDLVQDEIRIYDPASPSRVRTYSGAAVSGTYARTFLIDSRQHASMMGVHFRPGGALPFLGIPLDEIANAHVDLEHLWGREASELRERSMEAGSLTERFEILEAALVQRLRRRRSRHPATSLALRAFEDPLDVSRVRDLARLSGLSQRRFIQLFKAEVGLTPKLYSRLRRFHRAKDRIATLDGPPGWARFALDCGYCDQSHMIRDFGAFSGMSPAQYLRRRSDTTMSDHVPEAR